MKALAVARKTLRELLRDKRTFALTLGLPVVFMGIFGIAFGGQRSVQTMDVDVLNHDSGSLGASYVSILSQINTSSTSGTHLFAIHNVSSDSQGAADVKSRTVTLFVDIPRNFTTAIEAARGHRSATGSGNAVSLPPPVGSSNAPTNSSTVGPNATVVFTGDPGYSNYQIASQVAEGTLNGFVKRAAGLADPVQISSAAVTSAQLTTYDFIVPGLMVFSIINMAPQVAALLARETEQRTLDRMRLTRMRVVDLLLGVTLAQIVMSILALALMFATADALGFHNQGSFADALVVTFITVLCVLGAGLIIGAFSTKTQDAANIGIIVSIPASFLSGAFFPIPPVNLFTFDGTTYQLYDILPTTHAVRAMREVLTLGEGLDAVAAELAALAILTVAFFFVGAVFYTTRRLRSE
jgi:ABC-2 type transport system permease protein